MSEIRAARAVLNDRQSAACGRADGVVHPMQLILSGFDLEFSEVTAAARASTAGGLEWLATVGIEPRHIGSAISGAWLDGFALGLILAERR
jgi:hypothetical protein